MLLDNMKLNIFEESAAHVLNIVKAFFDQVNLVVLLGYVA